MTHIPSSVRELATRLNYLDGLMTAAQWQRAALVFAFTQDGRGKNASSSVFGILNCKAFAALGISGLKSHTTVERYRAAWQSAIDAGKAVPVAPGDPYREPAMEWPAAPGAAVLSSRATITAPDEMTPAEKEKLILSLLDPATVEVMFGDRHKRAVFAANMGAYGGATMRTEPATPRTLSEPASVPCSRRPGTPSTASSSWSPTRRTYPPMPLRCSAR
jgi:hypothetical protein